MLNPHNARDGINTRLYASAEDDVKATNQARLAQGDREGHVLHRDARVLGFCVVLVLALLYSVYQNIEQGKQGVREVPYVAVVDYLGNHQPLLKLDALPITPEQSQIIGPVMTWVELVRVISSDPQAFDRAWGLADEYTSDVARQQMLEFRREQRQRQQQGTRVNVSRPTVRPIGQKSRSYFVRWDEVAVDVNGLAIEAESGQWEATITVGDFQSEAAKKARDLRRRNRDYRNLYGVMVDDVSWSGRPFLGPIPPHMR